VSRRKEMQLLFWLVDGLLGGWIVGRIMSAERRDLLMNAIMGIAGGVAAGFLIEAALPHVQGKMIYTNLAAVTGALALAALSRVATGRRGYA
jgi:uncharacterized membrane protein YeaQ/YmgE (transglycosylase-associated protein family)